MELAILNARGACDLHAHHGSRTVDSQSSFIILTTGWHIRWRLNGSNHANISINYIAGNLFAQVAHAELHRGSTCAGMVDTAAELLQWCKRTLYMCCMMLNVMIKIMQCQSILCWSMRAGGGDDSSPRQGGNYFSSLRNSHSRNTVMHFDSAKLCAAINTWLASVASQGSHPKFPGSPLRDGAEEADPEMAAGRWRH